MKDLFVPFEEAKAMKELGFDEPCMGYYIFDKYDLINTEFYYHKLHVDDAYTNPLCINSLHAVPKKTNAPRVSAPLYSQAFKWFRGKYKLFPEINLHDRVNQETWRFEISVLGYYELAYNQNIDKEPYFQTYEDAELDCLRKLIEIVKNHNNPK